MLASNLNGTLSVWKTVLTMYNFMGHHGKLIPLQMFQVDSKVPFFSNQSIINKWLRFLKKILPHSPRNSMKNSPTSENILIGELELVHYQNKPTSITHHFMHSQIWGLLRFRLIIPVSTTERFFISPDSSALHQLIDKVCCSRVWIHFLNSQVSEVCVD